MKQFCLLFDDKKYFHSLSHCFSNEFLSAEIVIEEEEDDDDDDVDVDPKPPPLPVFFLLLVADKAVVEKVVAGCCVHKSGACI